MSALKLTMGRRHSCLPRAKCVNSAQKNAARQPEISMRYLAEAIDFFAFLTAISVAICCIPPAVSLFDLLYRLSLSPTQYMAVQQTNSGVSLFGAAVTAALLLAITHTLTALSDRSAALFSVVASLCLAVAVMIFWLFTYPISAATKRWTVTPERFETARRQWEYANAINAILTFIALVTVLLSIAAADPARGA